MSVHAFLQRWQDSGAAERANYQLFLSELCDFLDVPRPNPSLATGRDNQYVFERPVTGEEVPDENARRTVLKYPDARRANWPSANFIVGNPPFLGNWKMRSELGDGYTETLRRVYSEVPETADYVKNLKSRSHVGTPTPLFEAGIRWLAGARVLTRSFRGTSAR